MNLLRPNDFAQRVLIAAGAVNLLAVPLFSRLFSNERLNAVDPATMSNFGLVMIMVWGLLFLALAFNPSNGPLVFGALAIEKLCYVVAWTKTALATDIGALLRQDALTGVFYAVYGINDFAFAVLFLILAWRAARPIPPGTA